MHDLKNDLKDLISMSRDFLLNECPKNPDFYCSSELPAPNPNSMRETAINPLSPVQTTTRTLQPKPQAVAFLPQAPKIDTKQNKEEQPPQNTPKPIGQPLVPPRIPLQTKRLNFEKSEFFNLFSNLFPEIPLIDKPLDDACAIQKKNRWKEARQPAAVLVLSFQKDEKILAFLNNLAKAISISFAHAKVVSAMEVEKNQQWNDYLDSTDLKLVISTDYELYGLSSLMKYYRQGSIDDHHFIKETPLILLSDPRVYIKQPKLKSLIWRMITNEFNAPSQTESTHVATF